MRVFLIPSLLLLTTVEGGYYKVRAPPPPALPPATIHYGPHPPTHYHHGSPTSSSHHSHRPSPHHHHFPYHSSRKPPSPPRDFHYYPQPPPPPPPYPPKKPNYIPPWKGPNSFRAPAIKETFNPPPITYQVAPTFVRDDDKGPIHTIPAPNLSPADKPFQYDHLNKVNQANAALNAVLNHGTQHLSAPHYHGYQVTEDPTAHRPHSGTLAYFAPDPDPSLPTYKIPPTTDPKSQPSNGQVPVDLYLQQQAEAAQVQHNTDSNTLTAQDLFNLLNYQSNLIPQNQLQQHVLQPNVQFYNQPALAPQVYQENLQQQQQFSPQFQTFNYDEQTQQSAHGSDSFPSASMNLQLLQPEARISSESAGSFQIDNRVATTDRKDSVIQHSQHRSNVPPSNHAMLDGINDNKTYKNQAADEVTHFPTPNTNTLNAGKIISDSPRGVEEVQPKENVQLQKSIQIYENPYTESRSTKSGLIDYNEDYSQEEFDEKEKLLERS